MKHKAAIALPALVACFAAPWPGFAQMQYAPPPYQDRTPGYQAPEPRAGPPPVVWAPPSATAPNDDPFKLQSQFDLSFEKLLQRLDPPQPPKPP
jgi:hypothetical protein